MTLKGGLSLNISRGGGNYTLCECNSCSLIFQKEILNDQGMKLLYEKWIDPEKVINLFEQTYPLDYYTG